MKYILKRIFNRTINIIFGVILLFIIIGIIAGAINLFLQFGKLLMNSDITAHYVRLVSDVLTLFVLIELSRSLVSHFDEHRLRLTFIVDAGIVFVLRDIMIKLFEHKISIDEIYTLSVLLFVLGCLRTSAVIVFQHEKRLLVKKNKANSHFSVPMINPIEKNQVNQYNFLAEENLS